MKPKTLILFIFLSVFMMLNSCSKAYDSIVGPSAAEKDAKTRLSVVEALLTSQRQHTETWQVVAGACAVGCVLVLLIGTALGANTRRHHATA